MSFMLIVHSCRLCRTSAMAPKRRTRQNQNVEDSHSRSNEATANAIEDMAAMKLEMHQMM